MVKIFRTGVIALILLLQQSLLNARDLPLEIKLLMSGQQQNAAKVAADAKGWATGAELDWLHGNHWSTNLRISFDYMTMQEDSVLLEWDWPYWDERYIDWMLTGASRQEVDSISTVKEYWRPDSSYHGIFRPQQWVQELKFSLGVKYRQPLSERLSLYGELGFGFSRYERRLKMVEDWWKTFIWEWDSTKIASGDYSELEINNYQTFRELHQNDPDTYQLTEIYDADGTELTYRFRYEYYTRVTHFAPSKRGTVFFWTPVLGLRYQLTEIVDLDLSYQGVWYLDGSVAEKFEEVFHVKNGSHEFFPFKSKSMLTLGLTFRY